MALFIRIILSVCILSVSSLQGLAQAKVNYKLEVSQFSQAREGGALIYRGSPLKFNWTISKGDPLSEGEIPGRLVINVSTDSVLSNDDFVLLDSLCTLPEFSYSEKSVNHKLAAGSYWLFTTYYARGDQYARQSNTVKTPIQVFDLFLSVVEARLTDLKVSEYSQERTVHIEVASRVSCCEEQLGTFSSQWDVSLMKERSSNPEHLNTFYVSDTLSETSKMLIMDESLYNDVDFSSYKFIQLQLSSSYFSENYVQISDTTFLLPIKVIRDVESANALQRENYPFLTYGKFTLTEEEIKSINIEESLEQAEIFYGLVEKALQAVAQQNHAEATLWSDSAFSFSGRNKISTLLFVEPSIVADLYSGLFKWMDAKSLYTGDDQINLNFRLGEAMKMEDLIKEGYRNIVRTILPDSLDLVNEVEAGGFFREEDVFRNENLTSLPILWRERSVPALEHFIRILDFESADLMVSHVQQHIDLVQPLWRLIVSDSILKNYFSYLGNSVSENNEMLDFQLQRIRYYAETGMFLEGKAAIREASNAFECGYKFSSVEFWKAAALFYESLGDYSSADSLYQQCDTYYERESKSGHIQKDIAKLFSYNSLTLSAKHTSIKDQEVGEILTRSLDNVRKDKDRFFTYLELLGNQELGRKLGFLRSGIYGGFYLNQLELLNAQNSFFLSNEWMKDLAFFLGRDGKLEEAISLYDQLFTIEELKALAFRLGFSEESQVFYSQKSQETFSRLLNVVETYQHSSPSENADAAIETCLQQALFHHAFILRGNYRLLYDIYRSDNPQVQRLYTLWQTLREYLNKLYVEDEPDKAGMENVRKEILDTEKKLIRLARDTSSMGFDYIPPIDSIRSRLRASEAAVEIVRYHVNHLIYYGKEVKYAALVVRKSGPVQLIPFAVSGDLMEGKNFKYYRNAIQLQLKDELSYDVYWKSLAAALPGVSKVYFAPDGVFHLINPNTLYNATTKKYVVDELEVETVPTIGLLKERRASKLTSLTILGNPIYNKDNTSTQKSDSARTSREFFSSTPIAPLPGTKVEAETIASLFKKSGSSVNMLVGGAATKQNLFQSDESSILHLATHGFWIDKPATGSTYHNLFETMSSSGLVLADAQRAQGKRYILQSQGILTSAEIQDMNLFNTGLVVLSACETGLGEVVPGEGLYGLKRALQRAGVHQTITSLWKVDDNATMEFMLSFYKSLISSGNVSQSFQDALATQKQKYEEPYFWGAFVLTTN